MAKLVCGLLGEREPANHGAMWEAVLLFFHHFPKAMATVDARSLLFPRFLRLLRAGFLGSAETSCPSVLPLVALVPNDLACPEPEASSFFTDVLEGLWRGARAKDGGAAFLVALVEVGVYLLAKPDPPPRPLAVPVAN
jgi:hypothetical protein